MDLALCYMLHMPQDICPRSSPTKIGAAGPFYRRQTQGLEVAGDFCKVPQPVAREDQEPPS